MHPKLYSWIDRRPKNTFSEKAPGPLNLLKQHQGHRPKNHTKRPGQPSTACLLGNQTNEITHIRFVHQHVDPLEAKKVGVSCISKTFQDVLKPPHQRNLWPKMAKIWGEAAELAKVVLYILESWNTFWDKPAPIKTTPPDFIHSQKERINMFSMPNPSWNWVLVIFTEHLWCEHLKISMTDHFQDPIATWSSQMGTPTRKHKISRHSW